MSLPAAADESGPFLVLHTPAIAVAVPDRALLIDIAHAGSRLVAVGEHGVVIYSDDNGQSWTQARVPVDISLTCVAFATPEIGWAAGDYGTILHTTDGGASWQVQLYGDQVIALMGPAAAAYQAANPNSDLAARAVRRAGIFAQDGLDKPFLAITAFSPQKVMVFGAYRMTELSNDGGKTWADWSLHVGDPISHNLYYTAWVGSSLYIAAEVGTILRSDDQGNSFQLLTNENSLPNTLLGLVDAGGGAIVTYGVAGAVLRSTDQGKDWTQINIATQSNLTAGVTLRSGTILLTSEDGNVFVSKDHGQSFQLASGNQGMGLFGVVQAGNGDVVFVGDDGVRVAPAAAFN